MAQWQQNSGKRSTKLAFWSGLVGGFIAVSCAAACPTALADAPRAVAADKLPADVRLNPPKDYDGYFPWPPLTSAEGWKERAAEVRRQLLVSQNLWPMPDKTPLNAVVHTPLDQGDYTIEKVYFESVPGLFVTGNLYRPKGKAAKVPAMLFAHGHWPEARFMDTGKAAVRKEISIGAERFENGGRSIMQSLCVQLARMGVVVFHYDMMGYCDSKQLPMGLVHGFAKQRPEMNTLINWGFFSPQGEAHLQSVMGLQTWNSIRSLDFILSLPEVDPTRVGITGASGGGTQSFVLAAIDPRISLAVPAVMVSTSMQGGCTCENASVMRVETGNIELAALFAPKPMAMTTANDWTKEMRAKGFPELKQHWTMMGAEKNVELIDLTHFVHNYNYVSRSAMYNFVNKHFKLGFDEPIIEEDYKRLEIPQLSVWDVAHPQPAGGDDFERKLAAQLHAASEAKLATLTPKDPAGVTAWREVFGGGVQAIFGRHLPAAGEVEYDLKDETDLGDYARYVALLKNKKFGEEVPVLFFHPKDRWTGRVVIWLNENGKSSLCAADGKPTAAVAQLVKAGTAVCGIDMLFQGEFLANGKPVERTRKVPNPREFAGYTFGYNYPLFTQRVHDVLTAISFCQNHAQKPTEIDVVALDSTGPIAAAARSLAGPVVSKGVFATGGFRFGKLLDFHHVNFVAGGAKYGDLPGLLALSAPNKTLVFGETAESLPLAKTVFTAGGNAGALTLDEAQGDAMTQKTLAYLLAK